MEECITAHEKYINAADFNEDENVADEWIRKAEAVTRLAYVRIDLYLRQPNALILATVNEVHERLRQEIDLVPKSS